MTFTVSIEVSHDDPLAAHSFALDLCGVVEGYHRKNPLAQMGYPRILHVELPNKSRKDFSAVEPGNALLNKQAPQLPGEPSEPIQASPPDCVPIKRAILDNETEFEYQARIGYIP